MRVMLEGEDEGLVKRLAQEGKESTTREYRFFSRNVKKWVMARQGFNQIQTARSRTCRSAGAA